MSSQRLANWEAGHSRLDVITAAKLRDLIDVTCAGALRRAAMIGLVLPGLLDIEATRAHAIDGADAPRSEGAFDALEECRCQGRRDWAVTYLEGTSQ